MLALTAFEQNGTGTEAARWIGLIVAVLGMCLLFSDLIINIKKRKNTKLNVIGFVFLSLSVVCYVLTQFVFTDSLPTLVTYIWIPFLAAYFVSDVIVAVSIGKQNAQKKREEKLQAAQAVLAEDAAKAEEVAKQENESDSLE